MVASLDTSLLVVQTSKGAQEWEAVSDVKDEVLLAFGKHVNSSENTEKKSKSFARKKYSHRKMSQKRGLREDSSVPVLREGKKSKKQGQNWPPV